MEIFDGCLAIKLIWVGIYNIFCGYKVTQKMAFSVELDKHSLSVGSGASAEWKIILRWILIFSDGLRLSPQENVWKGVFSQRTPFEASEMSNIKGNAWELIPFCIITAL